MLFHIIKIGDKEYKCSLTMKSLVAAEKRIGENPLNMLMAVSDGGLPSFEKMMILFHESLQKYQHSITMDEAYDLYDSYVADGNSFAEFMAELINIFKASGIIQEDKKSKKGKVNNEKN